MEKPVYTLDAELTLCVGEQLLANAKRIELLKQIGRTENLTKSAKIAGFSYKGAWDTIEQMTQLTGDSLLERHAGGKGGGRTQLTKRGHQLLANLLLVQAEHARFINRLNRLANALEANDAVQTDVALKTSARNQFAGIVVSILQGPVNDEVSLLVNGRLMLVSSITHGSGRELQLEIGMRAYALVKASAITIEPAGATLTSGPNRFAGIVQAVVAGEQRSEVTLLLDSDLPLVCTLPNDALALQPIAPGSAVLAVIAPASVLLGVAA